MRMPPWLMPVVPMLIALLMSAPAAGLEIPEFTPNVVDPQGLLDAAGTERVNTELQQIRDSSQIWGAVYIVESLDGEAIEEVAVKAFEKWELGKAGVDNGLLLVLAMNDRQSRFEVGYGLEGTITDVAALHALDVHLAPQMRNGDVAGAIVDAFGYLSRLVEQDPVAVAELAEAGAAEPEENWTRGLIAWCVMLVPVWLGAPIRKAWVDRRRRSLMEANPALALRADEEVANADDAAAKKGSWKATLGIGAFLTINPGLFVFMLSAMDQYVYYASLVIPTLIVFLMAYVSGRKYGSPERYQQHLEKVAKQRAEYISKGYLVQNAAGKYSYTPAYHASRRSSSSSSSSGRSSSSGGGRSGGGGASSRW